LDIPSADRHDSADTTTRRRKRTFFFFSQEFRRIITYPAFSATIPTWRKEVEHSLLPFADIGRRERWFRRCLRKCYTAGTKLAQSTRCSSLHYALFNNVLTAEPCDAQPSHGQRAVFNHRQKILKLDHNLRINGTHLSAI